MQPKEEMAPTDNPPSTEAAATKEPSTAKAEEIAPVVKPPLMASGTGIESSEDWETEMTDVPEPSSEKVEEVTPLVQPSVAALGTCIEPTEDWEAETIDVPEQVQEQKQSEEWVIVEAEHASSVEPGEVGKEEVNMAAECKADEGPKEKALLEGQIEAHTEQSEVSEMEACTTGGQLALAEEKTDADKVEEKRNQLVPTTEEEKEEGEITSDDESENIRDSGHTEQGVWGPLDCNQFNTS